MNQRRKIFIITIVVILAALSMYQVGRHSFKLDVKSCIQKDTTLAGNGEECIKHLIDLK